MLKRSRKRNKEFEQKLKEMRKTMKTKPKTDKNNSKITVNENCKKTIAVKVHGKSTQKVNNKENLNTQNRANYNSKVKRPFGATSINWGTSATPGNQFQYPTYFPVTDCVKAPPKGEWKRKEISGKPGKPGSKLAQITATSVAIPFSVPESGPLMDKTSSIEISIDKHNFEYSSNLNSKVSGPLRESELLNANHKFKNSKNEEYEGVPREVFLQSHEKRLPLSKISNENSGYQGERVTNGINNWDLNHIDEVAEDITMEYINQNMTEETFQDYGEEEPISKNSLPAPQPMVDYKAARDQKKWEKVNSVHGMF